MNVLSVLNQPTGRDKVARFIQYLCRALSYLRKSDSDYYKSLEGTFSIFRKLLRFGRSLESLYLASKLMDDGDIIKRLAALIKISNGCYLLCDHIDTLGRLKIVNVDAKNWNFSANRYWLLTDVLTLIQNYFQLKKYYFICKSGNVKENEKNIRFLVPLYLDILKNLCDIFLPLCTINVVKLNPGMSGFFGMMSSLLGFLLLFITFSEPRIGPKC